MFNRWFLIWWLIVCIQSALLFVAFKYDLHIILTAADPTYISWGVLVLYIITTGLIGVHTHNADYRSVNTEPFWFISEVCLSLGMLGTLIGFIMMLNLSFNSIDVNNAVSLQRALGQLSIGLGTAIWTTMVGLSAGILLKAQLVNLEHGYEENNLLS